jgi:inactivated superfamily I helicase
MKAKDPITVLDIYKWLPDYGENAISVTLESSNLIINILHDSVNESNEDGLAINFSNTCSFFFSSFPGIDTTCINYVKYQELGNLVEFQDSDAANKWSSQLNFLDKIRHYQILFLSENKRIDVFATGFSFQKSHNS